MGGRAAVRIKLMCTAPAAPAGIELASMIVPERGEAVLLSLLLQTAGPDGDWVLLLVGNWRTPPDHDGDLDDGPNVPPGRPCAR